MKIIVGLGNPGFCYRNTRHNIGFRVCCAFAKQHRLKIRTSGFASRYVRSVLAGHDVLVALPQTYMNNSGQALEQLLQSHAISLDNILVVVDDFHLPLGTIRLRSKGSSGGHKGLASICDRIGENFCRMRLGIGPKPQNTEILSFVLGRWPRKDKLVVKQMVDRAVAALNPFIAQGVEVAMSQYNEGVRDQKTHSDP